MSIGYSILNAPFIKYSNAPIFKLSLNGGLAQLARASALHAEGHRFDSDILHIKRSEEVRNITQVLSNKDVGNRPKGSYP